MADQDRQMISMCSIAGRAWPGRMFYSKRCRMADQARRSIGICTMQWQSRTGITLVCAPSLVRPSQVVCVNTIIPTSPYYTHRWRGGRG